MSDSTAATAIVQDVLTHPPDDTDAFQRFPLSRTVP